MTGTRWAAAERDQGVRAGRGDIVCVRVGHRRRRNEQGPWDAAKARAGSCIPSVLSVLAERQIAVLGGDGNSDTAPSPVAASISLCTCSPSTRWACS